MLLKLPSELHTILSLLAFSSSLRESFDTFFFLKLPHHYNGISYPEENWLINLSWLLELRSGTC